MDKSEITDARMAEGVLLGTSGRMTVALADGLTLGGATYDRAVLRQLTAGDILEAQEEAERLVYAKDGTLSLVMSPARMGREALRRQVARLEGEGGQTFEGPLGVEELGRLSGRDLAALQAGVELLDQAAVKSAEAAQNRGRAFAGGGSGAPAGGHGGQKDGDAV